MAKATSHVKEAMTVVTPIERLVKVLTSVCVAVAVMVSVGGNVEVVVVVVTVVVVVSVTRVAVSVGSTVENDVSVAVSVAVVCVRSRHEQTCCSGRSGRLTHAAGISRLPRPARRCTSVLKVLVLAVVVVVLVVVLVVTVSVGSGVKSGLTRTSVLVEVETDVSSTVTVGTTMVVTSVACVVTVVRLVDVDASRPEQKTTAMTLRTGWMSARISVEVHWSKKKLYGIAVAGPTSRPARRRNSVGCMATDVVLPCVVRPHNSMAGPFLVQDGHCP